MSQIDSTSDSDSNTSSSWIFIDECNSNGEFDKNKYYLNCSSEPVQELESKYSNSLNGDQETDSDGISIISESDDQRDHVSVEEVPTIQETFDETPAIENVGPLEQDLKEKIIENIRDKDEYYFNKYVVCAWVLIAVTLPLLLNFIVDLKQGNLNSKPVSVKTEGEDHFKPYEIPVVSDKELNIVLSDTNLDNKNKLLDDTCKTEYCEFQRNDIQNKKERKYDFKGEIDIHRLDNKERETIYDQSKEQGVKTKYMSENIDKNQIILIKNETNIKNKKYDDKKIHTQKKDYSTENYPTKYDIDKESSETGKQEKVKIKKMDESHKDNEKVNKQRNKENKKNKDNKKKKYKHTDCENESDCEARQIEHKKKRKHKNKDFKTDDDIHERSMEYDYYENKKKHYQEKKNRDLKTYDINGKRKEHKKKRKSKNAKDKHLQNGDHENLSNKEIERLKKVIEYQNKEIKKLLKQSKMQDKHIKVLEYKILKELNTLKRSEGLHSNPVFKDDQKDKMNSTSGDWYYRLYKGRSKFRDQQHASDWVFDRADYRNKKRNMKNNWYWNWMSDREQLRLKKGFWQFTY